MTTDGFYSAVAHNELPRCVLVRARCQDDIERLREKLKVGFPQYTPEADYPWRMNVGISNWAQYVMAAAEGIRYTNFKDAIHEVDPERAQTYTQVWWALHELEKDYTLRT